MPAATGSSATDSLRSHVAASTARAILDGGPWGQGFPEPTFDDEFVVLSSRVVGERHWKMVIRPADSDLTIDAIDLIAQSRHPECLHEGQEAVAVELLIAVDSPTFMREKRFRIAVHEPASANLAIQGLYEPGSFFKPFTVAWALAHGVVQPDEMLDMLLAGSSARVEVRVVSAVALDEDADPPHHLVIGVDHDIEGREPHVLVRPVQPVAGLALQSRWRGLPGSR